MGIALKKVDTIDVDALEKEFARSQANLKSRGRQDGAGQEYGADGKPIVKKPKRGATHKTLTIEEEQKYM